MAADDALAAAKQSAREIGSVLTRDPGDQGSLRHLALRSRSKKLCGGDRLDETERNKPVTHQLELLRSSWRIPQVDCPRSIVSTFVRDESDDAGADYNVLDLLRHVFCYPHGAESRIRGCVIARPDRLAWR